MTITDNFHAEFKAKIKELGLKKKDVMRHLGLTLPTLNHKLNNPKDLKVDEINKLKELNINIKL